MNTYIFLSHIAVIVATLFFCLKKGKEALLLFTCFAAVFANLFVTKQIQLFSLTVTASDVYAVGSLVCLNLIREYFGVQEAKKTIYYTFFSLIFFLMMSQLHLLYIPSVYDQTHDAFQKVLQSTPRIIISSISVFFIVQWIDLFFYGVFNKIFRGKVFSVRLFLSLILSQGFDTALFSFAALKGVVHFLFEVFLFSFLIKVIVISLLSPMTSLCKKWIPVKSYESL